jgi:hypothetical protein
LNLFFFTRELLFFTSVIGIGAARNQGALTKTKLVLMKGMFEMKMSYLTTDDLWLVVEDMQTVKLPLIQNTKSYLIFGPTLTAKYGVLGQLYKGTSQRPLAELLKETDFTHDTSERAIHLISIALEPISLLPQNTRDFLVKVRETFAPSLSDLNKSYEDEAALAKRRSASLEAMKPELEAFPVGPINLYTLVTAYLDAGKKIDTLLSSRADTVTDNESKRTKELSLHRVQTIGLLNQFRAALIQEIAVDQTLARDLEAKVFSYMDQIANTRSLRFASRTVAETDETIGGGAQPAQG